ncbi:MAG TPA: MFS transporter, partial [Candidatus Agrococcus pullicola]|nr:MFS transporter [Candidatus Agrococcus pullicola]
MTNPAPPSSATPQETPLRKNAEYVWWLSGEIMLSIGAGIGLFASPLIALLVTGSASAAGIVGLLGGIGSIAGMLPGGIMTDRYDRKLLVITGGLLGLAVKGLFIAVLLFGDAGMWTLGAIAFIDQLRGALFEPASTAMLRQIVTRKQLPTAVSVNQGRDAAVELGSGPAGGVLLGLGIAFPVIAQLLGHIGSLAMTLLLRD